MHSENPVTPMEWECLDGTLYVEDDETPYMVFCHEWLQIKDGTICAIELSKDLKSEIGEPKLLFKATDASWIKPVLDNDKFVTDGPFLIKNNNGLFMIWSSFGTEGYCVAISKSDNGTLNGTWNHFDELLFKKDGGHYMVFKTFENNPMLSLHWPNSKDEHIKEFVADLKLIYSALNEEFALEKLFIFKEKWQKEYPSAVRSWEDNWDILSTFFCISS